MLLCSNIFPFIDFSWLSSRKSVCRFRFLLNKRSSMCRILFELSDSCSIALSSLNNFWWSEWISLWLNIKYFSVIIPLNALSAISRILFSRRFSIFTILVPWKIKSSSSSRSVWVMWMFKRFSAMAKSPLSRYFNDDSWMTRFWRWGNLTKKSLVKYSIVLMFSIFKLWTSTFDFDIACFPSIEVILTTRLSLLNSFTLQLYFFHTKSSSKEHRSVVELQALIANSRKMNKLAFRMLKWFNSALKWAKYKLNLPHWDYKYELGTR